MQRDTGHRDTGHRDTCPRDFFMWHDYLGLRAMVTRLARAGDVQRLRSSSQDSPPGFEEPAWRPDATPGTSGSSGLRSPGSQGLGHTVEKGVCGFCRQNGESAEIYASHRLKARNGRVLCPVLRNYVCPVCGATGDTAHTRHYCPRADVIGPAAGPQYLKCRRLVNENMASCLPAVAEQLLKDLQKTYSEKSQIPDELLIALRFIFGSCTLQALDLVDQRAVTCVSSPSGRVVFQVLGGSARLYTCYTVGHYCPCPAFSFSVLRRNESLLCKHILAVYLCQAMGLCQQEQVSDQRMTLILSGKAEKDP
ncbi:hypothetical protein QTP70_020286 [Hemibagrus guttatus]|uniref:Uncharacterized protein n=1 Tax=Hemibagrus guttatus TaxID=175788 RepID=A0AAE0UJF0_9TELE|nr:hypothetical protein QTP70_020286 [Hemibagrus guttatus]